MSDAKSHSFQAEVSQVLHLVVNSLYSHKEVFLRELISNASDALDKRRFSAVQDKALAQEGSLRIRLTADAEAKTLSIDDNGIGMSEEELQANLGTIARSGTRDFLAKIEAAKAASDDGLQLIGQFGVGFYSAYLVADKVTVVTRRADSEQAYRWESDGKESFTITPAERAEAGTTLTLHLKEEQEEFLKEWTLKDLVSRYSDYIGYDIELSTYPRDDNGDEKKDEEPTFVKINQASALWQRNPKEVTEEQYEEFYKHFTHDYAAPRAHRHFKVEGTQLFSGILFLPTRPPFDLYDPEAKHGVRLHVRRVFVMDNCAELLPKWLRFVKGVVDSEDLPLNVSREMLQDSRAVRVIEKQVINNSLSMIEELKKEKGDEFFAFFKEFGAVLKEGIHFNSDQKERIAKLAHYESSSVDGLTSFEEYISRMQEGQTAIYYATGADRAILEASPHLETLKKRGLEVLFMTDGIDSFAVQSLGEFDGKKLVSAMDENLNLAENDSEEEKQEKEAQKAAAAPLIEGFQEILGDKVKEVRASDRLTDSPVCLVVPEGGQAPHIERMMMAQQMGMPAQKRILEVNPTHPIITALNDEQDGDKKKEWVEVLYDQALIAEGSPVQNPASFAQRLTRLLSQAVGSAS
jgi:molecular chaperone HtpG